MAERPLKSKDRDMRHRPYRRDARFALYFDPEADSALSEFGWSWLGRTRFDAEYTALPITNLHPDWHASAVAPPRLYGFHATLKAPIALADGFVARDLYDAADAFVQTRSSFTIAPLGLTDADGYLSLRTKAREPLLHEFADAVVRDFDRFRVPLPPEEKIRRGQKTLPPHLRAMLDRWGYPYVFETFRFHMTLTRALDDAGLAAVREALAPLLEPVLIEPVAVKALTIYVQPEPGEPFTVSERFAFGA